MITDLLAKAAIIIPAFLIAVTFHEFAHASMAIYLGDDTPRRMGRFTLNPFAHIDLMGLLFLLVFRIGWAKPVVFNPNNFKRVKLYSVLTGLAGPFMNFLLALIFLYFSKYLPFINMPQALMKSFAQVFEVTVYVNVMLGVFNLLPLPPLDGSHLLYALLPKSLKHVYFDIAQYSIFIFIILFSIPSIRIGFLMAILEVRNFLEILVI